MGIVLTRFPKLYRQHFLMKKMHFSVAFKIWNFSHRFFFLMKLSKVTFWNSQGLFIQHQVHWDLCRPKTRRKASFMEVGQIGIIFVIYILKSVCCESGKKPTPLPSPKYHLWDKTWQTEKPIIGYISELQKHFCLVRLYLLFSCKRGSRLWRWFRTLGPAYLILWGSPFFLVCLART